METFVTLAIPALLSILLIRVMLLPLQAVFKTGIHAGCGMLCLLLLNTTAGFTGVYFPINAVTVLIAGFGGVPGIGILALLEVL